MNKIEDMNDVRAAVAMLTSKVNEMCNSKTTEEVSEACVEAKNLLIELFKFNVNRTSR